MGKNKTNKAVDEICVPDCPCHVSCVLATVGSVRCSDRPCFNNATCTDGAEGGMHCHCDDHYIGKYCQGWYTLT